MFDSKKKEKDTKKSSNKIIKSLKSMEIIWTKLQKAEFKKQIKENMKKKEHSNACGDVIQKRCKQHSGPIVTLKGIAKFCKENTQGRS